MFKTIKLAALSFVIASFIIPNISFAQVADVVSDVDTSGGNNSSCVTIDNNLSYKNRKNNNKDDVMALQDFLNSVGYLNADSVTGFFGKLTESAVAKFQSSNDLVATPPGFVGVGTRAKINEMSCNGTTDKTGGVTTSYQGQTGYTSNLPDGCKPGARFSYLTGVSCDTNINNLPQGCKSVSGYSPITGQVCNRNIISQTQNCNSEQYLENGVCINQNSVPEYTPVRTSSSPEYINNMKSDFHVRVTKVSIPYIYVEYANMPSSGVNIISQATGKVIWRQELTKTDGYSGSMTITLPNNIVSSQAYYGYYTLQAYGYDNTIYAKSEQFYIGGKDTVVSTGLPTVKLYATKTDVKVGEINKLFWNSSNADSCIETIFNSSGVILESASVDISKSEGDNISVSSSDLKQTGKNPTITLTCKNKDGETKKSITLNVIDAGATPASTEVYLDKNVEISQVLNSSNKTHVVALLGENNFKNVTNGSVSSWKLQVYCPVDSGVVFEGNVGGPHNKCGDTNTFYSSELSANASILIGNFVNYSKVTGYAILYLSAYDKNGNEIGKTKKNIDMQASGQATISSFGKSPWGQKLVKSQASVQSNSFRAYYINTDSFKEISSQEVMDDPYLNYGGGSSKLPFGGTFGSEKLGVYWVGQFDYDTYQSPITFDFSNPQWDVVRLYIDGVLVHTYGGNTGSPKYVSTQTNGKHLVEIEYESKWHAGTFAAHMNKVSLSTMGGYIDSQQAKTIALGLKNKYSDLKVLSANVYESKDQNQGEIGLNFPETTDKAILFVSSYDPVKWHVYQQNLNGVDLKAVFVYSFAGASSVSSSFNTSIPIYYIRNEYIGGNEGAGSASIVSSKIGLPVDSFAGEYSPQLLTLPRPVSATLPIVNLSASPTSVSFGGQARLTWSSTGATSCRFTEGDNQFKNYENTTSGTNRYTQSLYATQKYTISCSSTGGDMVKSVSVLVTPQVSQVFSYSFENTAKVILKMVVGLVPIDLKYDINKDGKVDMLDSQAYLKATSVPEVIVNADKAYLVLRMIVGTLPVDLKYDTDGDGKLTLTDSLYYTQLDINQPLTTPTTPIINVKWGPQSNTPFNAGTSATSYAWAGACYKWTTVECGSGNVVTSGGQCVLGSRYSIDYGPTPCLVAPVSSSISATTNTIDAIAFGVYEGGPSYPRAEENVYVEIPVSAEGKVLVLTAYEQVNWILRNPNNVSISKIIAIGYKSQRVTSGDGKVLPVAENDSYTTNRIYKYAYDTSDSSFTDLVSWLATKGISLVPANFTGSYSAKGNPTFAAPLAYMLNTSIFPSQILGDFASNVSCTDIPRNLHRGDESTSVTSLQNFLFAKGLLSDSSTGFYGDKTVEAVKDYQATKGLPETGMVYDFTRAAIKAESCK